jgi:hypothetical protein
MGGAPRTTVGFQAVLVSGGHLKGTLEIHSMSFGAELRNRASIEKIKQVKKKKELESVNFMAELKGVEDVDTEASDD